MSAGCTNAYQDIFLSSLKIAHPCEARGSEDIGGGRFFSALPPEQGSLGVLHKRVGHGWMDLSLSG
jgi:hypothetical protein